MSQTVRTAQILEAHGVTFVIVDRAEDCLLAERLGVPISRAELARLMPIAPVPRTTVLALAEIKRVFPGAEIVSASTSPRKDPSWT